MVVVVTGGGRWFVIGSGDRRFVVVVTGGGRCLVVVVDGDR